MFQFYIVCKYIMIKQKHILEKMKTLAQSLDRPSKTVNNLIYFWHFQKLNQKIAYQCAEIIGYNTFWSFYLTLQFSNLIILICYMLYCYLFIPSTFSQQIYYSFFIVELSILLFFVIYRCSVINQNNLTFKSLNMKIFYQHQIKQNLSQKQLIHV